MKNRMHSAEQVKKLEKRQDAASRALALVQHPDFRHLVEKLSPRKDPFTELISMVEDDEPTDPYKVGLLLSEMRMEQRLQNLEEGILHELQCLANHIKGT